MVMPTNFRLAYNAGTDYVDLFPKTSIQAITDASQVYQITTLQVTIPAVSTMTQTITITTDSAMASSPVRMVLDSTGDQAESDYSTITQFQVNTNELVITRLYSMPTGSIDVTLIFFEQEGSGS